MAFFGDLEVIVMPHSGMYNLHKYNCFCLAIYFQVVKNFLTNAFCTAPFVKPLLIYMIWFLKAIIEIENKQALI